MRGWLKQHRWIFVWTALIAFYLFLVFFRGEGAGIQVCVGTFRSLHLEQILLCVGIGCLFMSVWLFLNKTEIKIILSVLLVLGVFAFGTLFITARLLIAGYLPGEVQDTYVNEEGKQIVVFSGFPDGVHEYEQHGVLALRISVNIGIDSTGQALRILFMNSLTLWFVGIGAGLIVGRKIFAVDTKRE